MEADRFDIGNAIQFGWESFKSNIGFFIVVVLLFWLVEGIPNAFTGAFPRNPAIVTIFSVIALLVGALVAMAAIRIGLNFCDGKEADYNDLYSAYPVFWKLLGAYVLFGLLVIAGLILLIVPGIYWAMKYQFALYLVVDKDMDIMAAFRKSGEITYGEKWHLLLFWLACLGIYILGVLACVVGLFVAIPMIFVAYAYVFRRLLVTAGEVEHGQPMPARPVTDEKGATEDVSPAVEVTPSEEAPEKPE